MENSNSVYICLVKPQRFQYYRWYVLNTKTGEVVPEDKASSNEKFPELAGFSFDAAGKNLYSIGGHMRPKLDPSDCEEQPYIFYRPYNVDYNIPSPPVKDLYIYSLEFKEWTKGTPMNQGRAIPVVVPLGDYLYVFGSDGVCPVTRHHSEENCHDCWAEVYCISLKSWERLPNPPVQLMETQYLRGKAVLGNDAYILLWNQYYFCVFDVRKKEWIGHLEKTPSRFPSNFCMYSTSVAVVDNIIYWYYRREVFAYDLMSNKTVEAPHADSIVYEFPYTMKNQPIPDSSNDQFGAPHLFVSGKDELCLVWLLPPVKDSQVEQTLYDQDMSRICHMTFKIKKSPSTIGVSLEPLQTHPSTFVVEGTIIMFISPQLQSENTDKEKDKLNEDRLQTSISQDLLKNISKTMFNLNDFTYVDDASEAVNFSVEPKAEMKADVASVKSLLLSLNIEKYLATFENNKIDMASLMSYDLKDLRGLGIPTGPALKLLAPLRSMQHQKVQASEDFI